MCFLFLFFSLHIFALAFRPEISRPNRLTHQFTYFTYLLRQSATTTSTTAPTAPSRAHASSTTPGHATTSMARASARNPGKASRATLTPTNAPRTREFAETPLLAASTQTGAMSVCAPTQLCMMQLAGIALVRDVEFWNSENALRRKTFC